MSTCSSSSRNKLHYALTQNKKKHTHKHYDDYADRGYLRMVLLLRLSDGALCSMYEHPAVSVTGCGVISGDRHQASILILFDNGQFRQQVATCPLCQSYIVIRQRAPRYVSDAD